MNLFRLPPRETPTMDHMSVETVLVTGVSGGIGLELARSFAAEGCRLVLVSHNGNALADLAIELKETHKTQAQVITADLALPETPARLLAQLQSAGLRVDVLVNSAGFDAQGKFAELPLGQQLEMLQVNITSLTHLTRLLLPGIIERCRGGPQGRLDGGLPTRPRHGSLLCDQGLRAFVH
jgi:short-subunit dehydrogenase